MNYINEILNEIITTTQSPGMTSNTGESLFDLFKIAAEEIEKLDVRDFSPDTRFSYTIIRQKFRRLACMSSYNGNDAAKFFSLATNLLAVLQHYGEYGSSALTRDFTYVTEPTLKSIIERDYVELNNIVIADGAWKSAVVLSGSILEALLYDFLERPSYYQQAMASQKAPKRGGAVIDIKLKEWKLFDLIQVAVDVGILPLARANSIDEILRNFRNFVHPKVELRNQFPCTEAEALLAKGALDSVCNHLQSI